MKTALTENGQIGIPPEIRRADHLEPGNLFSFDRLNPGHYLLTKLAAQPQRFTVATADDGLPVIRANGGVITAQMVEHIESQTP